MRDSYLFTVFHKELSESDKEQFRQCSINQQKDWYIGYLENKCLDMVPSRATSTDKDVIAEDCSNPNGMVMDNNPEVRKAVASHLDNVLTKLHAERKNKSYKKVDTH